MASLLAGIGKWLLSFGVNAAWKAIMEKRAGPTAQLLDTIIAGQAEIARQIEDLSIKVEILEAMRLILYWSKRMDEIMDDFKNFNGGVINESDPAYAELLSALRSENHGVRYRTFSIYNAVIGLPGQGAGAIYVWHGQAYPKLRDERNLYYFMADYVKDMDNKLGPIAYLLRQGLVLSLFTSYSEADAERLHRECEERVNTISDRLFNTLYPPGLRFLKPSLDNAGNQNGDRWHRWQQKDKRDHYIVMHNFHIPSLASSKEPIQTNKVEAWNFALKQDSVPLGPMQFLSAWDNRGNKRLRYNRRYQQGWSLAFSTSTDSYSSAILFKLIPLEESEAGREPAFRFVAYYESSKGIVKNNNDTFQNVFIPLSPKRALSDLKAKLA